MTWFVYCPACRKDVKPLTRPGTEGEPGEMPQVFRSEHQSRAEGCSLIVCSKCGVAFESNTSLSCRRRAVPSDAEIGVAVAGAVGREIDRGVMDEIEREKGVDAEKRISDAIDAIILSARCGGPAEDRGQFREDILDEFRRLWKQQTERRDR